MFTKLLQDQSAQPGGYLDAPTERVSDVRDDSLILVVDDEPTYRDVLSVALQREGFRVITAADGEDALASFEASQPSLVLLDLMLPKISGLDVCREIRTRSSVPIIMVTARNSELDAVLGLELGADDYVTKPFRLRELVARIRVRLRRPPVEIERDGDLPDVITVGDVSIDTSRHEVIVRGQLVPLPLKEYQLLEILMENHGRVLSRNVLVDRVWGVNYYGDMKTLDVHIKRLRLKIESNPSRPQRIVTIRGVGYRYDG